MNLGINCFSLNPNYSGGINSYTFGLLDGFVNSGTGNNFQIYATKRNIHLFTKYSQYKNFQVIRIPDSPIKKAFRICAFASLSQNIYKTVCDILYADVCKIMDSKSDLIYIPTTFLFPYKFKKTTLISLHDLQQLHYPQFFSKAELLNRKIHYELSVKLADYIQSSSQFIKDDILSHYKNINKNQLIVISEGVNVDLFSQDLDTSYLSNKYNIPEEFILFPAQLWHHKNHITLLKSLNLIKKEYNQKIPLVLTGKPAAALQNISEFFKRERTRFCSSSGTYPHRRFKGFVQEG